MNLVAGWWNNHQPEMIACGFAIVAVIIAIVAGMTFKHGGQPHPGIRHGCDDRPDSCPSKLKRAGEGS